MLMFRQRTPCLATASPAIVCLCGLLIGACQTHEPESLAPARQDGDGAAPLSASDVVACELPGQIRSLGGGPVMARGQVVRTTVLHCAQRSGRVIDAP